MNGEGNIFLNGQEVGAQNTILYVVFTTNYDITEILLSKNQLYSNSILLTIASFYWQL